MNSFRAQSFAERLRLGLAVIHGDQFEADSEIVDGRHSPPPERTRRISKSVYSEVASELIPPGIVNLRLVVGSFTYFGPLQMCCPLNYVAFS